MITHRSIESERWLTEKRLGPALFGPPLDRGLISKKRRWIRQVGWLLFLAPLSAAGMTLDEAVRRGLSINPLVAQAEQELAEAATEVDIARDGYWPTVGLSAGPENFSTSNFGYDLTASQTLYDWGRVSSQVDGASAAFRQFEEELVLVSQEAALDIAEVYLDVLNAREREAVVERHIEALQRIERLADSRSQVGYADRTESDRAALELARAREQAALEEGTRRDAVLQFRSRQRAE